MKFQGKETTFVLEHHVQFIKFKEYYFNVLNDFIEKYFLNEKENYFQNIKKPTIHAPILKKILTKETQYSMLFPQLKNLSFSSQFKYPIMPNDIKIYTLKNTQDLCLFLFYIYVVEFYKINHSAKIHHRFIKLQYNNNNAEIKLLKERKSLTFSFTYYSNDGIRHTDFKTIKNMLLTEADDLMCYQKLMEIDGILFKWFR